MLSIVGTLTLPWKTKVALYALLFFSYLAIASSIATEVEVHLLSESKDFTFHFAPLELCLVTENDIVIIAASMPMLRVLWNGRHPTSTHPSYAMEDASRIGSISSALNRSRRRDTATHSMHFQDHDEEKGLGTIPELSTHGLTMTMTAESDGERYKGAGVSVKSSVGSAEQASVPASLKHQE